MQSKRANPMTRKPGAAMKDLDLSGAPAHTAVKDPSVVMTKTDLIDKGAKKTKLTKKDRDTAINPPRSQ